MQFGTLVFAGISLCFAGTRARMDQTKSKDSPGMSRCTPSAAGSALAGQSRDLVLG